MRAVLLEEAFGVERLAIREITEPEPASHEVLVRISAASLNYRDLLVVTGRYNPRQRLPLVPCSDGVGRVVRTGSAVSRVKTGDRVCPTLAPLWIGGAPDIQAMRHTLGSPLDGTLSEYMVLAESALVKVPEHLTDVEAACLPCAALTAWCALAETARVLPGETVLTQGTGGVSLFALLFGKSFGARVIVTSKSDEKLERASQLGADATINYVTEPAWGDVARGMTDGAGVDHVIDVGGAATLPQSLRALRPGGSVSLIGNLSGATLELDLLSIVMRRFRIEGVLVGSRSSFEALNRAVDHGKLRPPIDRAFPVREVRRAFEHLESGTHFGKVVLDLGDQAW